MTSIAGAVNRSFTYQASGQAATDQRSPVAAWSYTTDKAGRMSATVLNAVTQTTAAYDADELRIANTNSLTGTVTHYVYDADGQLIAEMNGATGAAIREYIWLGALPIGYVDRLGSAGASRLFFVHADHLARPQKITDAARAIVWDGVFAPFGEIYSVTGSIVNVLMFPGQVYDPETGLMQNWHRDYDANLGRYLQSDPIGLEGGINTYAYVGGNPLRRIDPDGRIGFALPAVPAVVEGLAQAAIGLGIAWGIWHALPPANDNEELSDDEYDRMQACFNCERQRQIIEKQKKATLGLSIGFSVRNQASASLRFYNTAARRNEHPDSQAQRRLPRIRGRSNANVSDGTALSMSGNLRELLANTFRFVAREVEICCPPTTEFNALKLPGLSKHLLALRLQAQSGPIPCPDALSLFQEAAHAGFAPSASELAVHYQFGALLPVDADQAAIWYEKAIEWRYLEAAPDYAVLVGATEASPEVRERFFALAMKGVELRIPRCFDLAVSLAPEGQLSTSDIERLCLDGLAAGNPTSLVQFAVNLKSGPTKDKERDAIAENLSDLFVLTLKDMAS